MVLEVPHICISSGNNTEALKKDTSAFQFMFGPLVFLVRHTATLHHCMRDERLPGCNSCTHQWLVNPIVLYRNTIHLQYHFIGQKQCSFHLNLPAGTTSYFNYWKAFSYLNQSFLQLKCTINSRFILVFKKIPSSTAHLHTLQYTEAQTQDEQNIFYIKSWSQCSKLPTPVFGQASPFRAQSRNFGNEQSLF